MSNLISGKETLIALANGEEVEYKTTDNVGSKWHQAKMLTVNTIMNFDDACILFRLKPRTITINNIEVPAPFEPKDGDTVFALDNAHPDGFSSFVFDSDFFTINFGAWRTELEIRQVVAALRQLLGAVNESTTKL